MKKEDYIENLQGFIDHFKTQIRQAQEAEDRSFDFEQAEKDIETFNAAIDALKKSS